MTAMDFKQLKISKICISGALESVWLDIANPHKSLVPGVQSINGE
jgi:hypothetical protein